LRNINLGAKVTYEFGYLDRKPNIIQILIEIVKGHWKPVIFIESDGNLVLFEI
jgi:hypothetical protein